MSTITDEQFRAATREPRYTDVHQRFIPHLSPSLRKALKARDDAHARWVDLEDEAHAARQAIDTARRQDARDLTEAVKAGKGDPGTKRTDAAERALVVALERLRQAKEAATLADTAVATGYASELPSLIPVALADARSAAEDYTETVRSVMTEGQVRILESRNRLADALSGMSAVRAIIRPIHQYGELMPGYPEVRWPNLNGGELAALRANLDSIERSIENHQASQRVTAPADRALTVSRPENPTGEVPSLAGVAGEGG